MLDERFSKNVKFQKKQRNVIEKRENCLNREILLDVEIFSSALIIFPRRMLKNIFRNRKLRKNHINTFLITIYKQKKNNKTYGNSYLLSIRNLFNLIFMERK